MNHFYVISPVGTDLTFTDKKGILRELAATHDIEPFFPLERHREFSVDVTIKDILSAEFVLADLSLERPSCYFELGLAQAVGAHVVFIAKAGTVIHQVGAPCNLTFYSDLNQYRSEISRILAGRVVQRSHP